MTSSNLETTTVPITQDYDANNGSDAKAYGDATADIQSDTSAVGATYGSVDYSPDNSVAPVSVVIAPEVHKGNTSGKSNPSATQSGDTPLMTAIKVLAPVAGAVLIYYLTRDKPQTQGWYYY